MSSLRSRTLVATLLAAVLPLASVGMWARSMLVGQAESEHQASLDSSVLATQRTLTERMATLKRSVDRLCDRDFVIDRLVVNLATDRFDADQQDQLLVLLPSMMRSLDLDTLEILEMEHATQAARVLASGHYPGRTGAMDEALARAVKTNGEEPFVQPVRVQGTSVATSEHALLTACTVDRNNVRLAVVGGQFLLPTFLHDVLSNRTAVQMRLVSGDQAARADERLVRDFRGDAGDSAARLVALVDRRPLEERLAALDRGFFVAAGLAVLLAGIIGLVLAQTFSRPLRVLEQAASRVASGDWSSTLPVSESGEVGRVLVAFNTMIHDLTRTRERLLRAERVAAWRDIAQRIAHEIKNPLSPIQVSIETMRKTYERSHPDFAEIFEESTRTILEEVERLRRIVSEFSEFARLPRPKLAEVDLHSVVEHVVSLHQGQSTELVIIGGSGPLPLRADREQLTQVLVNLVQNAIDAATARHGSSGGIVRVGVQPKPPAEVELAVEDNGPGIAADQRARIFEPYFTTKAGGTGLGLAIVHRILEEHGGRIDVGCTQAGGTVFRIVLPVQGPPASAEASKSAATLVL